MGGNEIVADFCLPYLCCSDTSSIKYIVFAELKIDIPPKICNHHEKYPIKYSPINATLHHGNSVEGDELAKDDGGHYYIIPKKMEPGEYSITISLGDKSTTYLFEIVEHPNARFSGHEKEPRVNDAKTKYIWPFEATFKRDDWLYTWYKRYKRESEVKDTLVGDGQTYVHESPLQKPIAFVLCLKVSNGACSVESVNTCEFNPPDRNVGFLRRMLGDHA
jgi:hypothetical protein